MEEYEDLEEMAMGAKGKHKMAMMKKEEKRRVMRRLKETLKISGSWNDEDLTAGMIEEVFIDLVKGFKDPMVKALFDKEPYKAMVNSLIDITTILQMQEEVEEDALLKKI